MIIITNETTGQLIEFEITKFPDGTSQAWHLNPAPKQKDEVRIQYKFENEAEIFHLYQLGHLLLTLTNKKANLFCDTLPYARQDKTTTNTSTFALYPFLRLMGQVFESITTVDMHNIKAVKDIIMPSIININPSPRIQQVLKQSNTDYVCFPDAGAAARGYQYDEEYYGAPIILEKKRNQETGAIEGLKYKHKFPIDLTGKTILIVDDLCDGGATFIAAAKLLKESGANKVALYTTHGIYSKGIEHLHINGLDEVYNYHGSMIQNTGDKK